MIKKLLALTAAGIIGSAGLVHAASFADIDANEDGAVTQEEFAAAYPDAGEEAWSAADANADGQLSEDELTAAVESGVIPAE